MKVEREIRTKINVQVILKFDTDYNLVQFRDGTLEVVYNNGNFVGLEMQGRLMPKLVKELLESPPTVCSKCLSKYATTKYSQLQVCMWCNDRLNDEFDEGGH